MKVSIIIPTLNEAANIGRLLHRLLEGGSEGIEEILVVDGGSEDGTLAIAGRAGAVCLSSTRRARAAQLNLGARQAKGEVLYFVHADTLPPKTYLSDIRQALTEDYPMGCFRYQFDSPRKVLKINAFFTRFDFRWCRGGDQSLFIKRPVFEELNGFRDNYIIMEDFEFIERARKTHRFKIIPRDMVVSARKYATNSYLRVQIANLIVFNMYRFGASQTSIANAYKRLLRYR